MRAISIFLPSLLLILVFLKGNEGVDCPRHWVEYEDFCYGIMEESSEWTNAEVECQIKGTGGHLVSFHKDSELAILAKRINNNYPNVREIWIGLHDSRKTDHWGWTDTNPFNYKPWSVDKEYMRGKGHCAYLSKETGFKIFHVGCCKKLKSYVCKSTV